MRSNIRTSLLTLLASAIVAITAPAAAQASFGVESFFAGNCNELHKECNKAPTPAEEKAKAELEGFTQAAGHPNWGVTEFVVKNKEIAPGVLFPEGTVKHVRIDVAPGVSTNPQAVTKCSQADFASTLIEFAPGHFAFNASKCPVSSEIGFNKVKVLFTGPTNKTLEGIVYNLEQPKGLSSEFGVALDLFPIIGAHLYAHTLIEGGVEYATDYHDFFDINVSEELPLVSSRLTFKGNIGTGGFLTNGTNCTGPGPQTTTKVTLEDSAAEKATEEFETPIGGSGCSLAELPFAPVFSVEPETKISDKPDGITTELTLPHDPNPEKVDSSDLKTATVTLPEGMTLNPSAGAGIEVCNLEQLGIGTRRNTACPAGSRLGTVTDEVPGLPPESLKGYVFLGENSTKTEPITGPPYTFFLSAESEKYNIKTRLKGTVKPNPKTGQLEATFTENPEQPFSDFIVHFNGGAYAPLANPLQCGVAATTSSFTPFARPLEAFTPEASAFTVEGCSSPLPFAPPQSTSVTPATGGAESNFTFNLERPEGQQYLEKVKTVLPPGLVGKIPTVPLCAEAQANAGTCSAASLIGTVR